MLNSTKLKEICLFEMGEPKSLKLVEKIYNMFRKPGRVFDSISVRIKLVNLKDRLDITDIDKFNYVKFVSKSFIDCSDHCCLTIEVKLV